MEGWINWTLSRLNGALAHPKVKIKILGMQGLGKMCWDIMEIFTKRLEIDMVPSSSRDLLWNNWPVLDTQSQNDCSFELGKWEFKGEYCQCDLFLQSGTFSWLPILDSIDEIVKQELGLGGVAVCTQRHQEGCCHLDKKFSYLNWGPSKSEQ